MTDRDHNIICDKSGFKCKKSETRKQWNGMIVRKDFWEPRQPQDFIPTPRENVNPKEVRNERPTPPNEFPPIGADDVI